jgi:hypothetical protein
MNLTPGKLYFINEHDVQSGQRSNYYKIGIVRDADGRDSKNRLLEHQTGNPRKLWIVEELEMPAVEAVETNLHYLFARNRVMGEWMQFDETELANAISKAKELATEVKANVIDFERAEKLKNMVSNGLKLEATEEAENWYVQIQNLSVVIKSCDKVLDDYRNYLYAAIEKGIDVSNRASVQSRAGAFRFDEKLFKEKYPDLHEKFSIISNPIKGPFRIKSAKDWIPDRGIIDEEQQKLIASMEVFLRNADHSMDTGFVLHEKHLGVLEVKKYAEWHSEIASTKLRVLTGEADGIDEICTWKRARKEVVTLDRKGIQTQYLDEYSASLVQGAETIALIVDPKRLEN